MTGASRIRLKPRLWLLQLAFVGVWLAFMARLVILQVIERERFLGAAREQQNLVIDIQAKRGFLYDCHFKVLAQDIDSYSYYVVPAQITNKGLAANKLRNLTGRSDWPRKFKDHPRFLWVARKTDRDLERRLEGSEIESLGRIVEPRRVYPSGDLALSLLGRVDVDNNGLSGIELQYNNLLAGKNGKAVLKRDGRGRSYLYDDRLLAEPVSGSDVILTLDLDLQHIVEQELALALTENNAGYGVGLFLRVGTGEILACATLDSLGVPASRNRAFSDQYEPGSTFKIIAVAAALSRGLFEPHTTLFVENGEFRIGGKIIHDDHEYSSLTVEDIVVYSSNIGAAKLALALGDDAMFKMIKEAGFVMPLGVDFPGEAAGQILRPSWRDHFLANVGFGHGISATPLQLVTLYDAIADGGYLCRPYLGIKTIDPDGTVRSLGRQLRIRRVFSADVAETITGFLRGVVERGTAKKASSGVVAIAGKTGTALKIDPSGRYDHRQARASFVGFFPAENPEVVGMLLFDSPKTSRYGGEAAAPAFKRIAERYYNLPQFMVDHLVDGHLPSGNETVASENLAQTDSDVQVEFGRILESSARYLADPGDEALVPDFVGLTIKQALVLAAMREIQCEFDGSGIVALQIPEAGQEYTEGMTIQLMCRANECSSE